MTPTQRIWTSREREELRALYTQGFTARQISGTLRRSLDSINKALGRYQFRQTMEKASLKKRTLTKIFVDPCACPYALAWPKRTKRTQVSMRALLPAVAWTLTVLKHE